MHSIITCSFLLFATLFILTFPLENASPAPYTDYDNIRELYELLLRNEALNDRTGHQVVRKGSRDPSLRLRFGRRSDPAWQEGREPSLRLRFGRSADDVRGYSKQLRFGRSDDTAWQHDVASSENDVIEN
uniref:Short neuropeptide F n=1 Tax=Strigamia maritima TaxID=126957 RepID=T1J0C8_STRMM